VTGIKKPVALTTGFGSYSESLLFKPNSNFINQALNLAEILKLTFIVNSYWS